MEQPGSNVLLFDLIAIAIIILLILRAFGIDIVSDWSSVMSP